MKKKQTFPRITIKHRGPSIFEVARQVHGTTARHCEYCGRPMTPSDVNDFGTLCERCYMNEYYND